MSIATAYSTKPLPDAVNDLRHQCGDPNPRVVIFFASSKYEPAALSRQMQETFPKSCIAGCSTAGEIAGGRMLTGSVVAMFLGSDVVENAASAIVADLGSEACVQEAFSEFQRHFGSPVPSMDIHKHVGLVLVDGLSRSEEWLMEQIGIRSDLFFIGGSAGDDLKFQKTHVFATGNAYTGAAVLTLLKLKSGFEIAKTQSFKSTGKRLVATRVDEALRKVEQFDNRPALEAYAQAVGVPPAQAAAKFLRHPVGLIVNGEPFVRSPQRPDGQSIRFYCEIKQGMELEVLEGTDIIADTARTIEAKKTAMGHVSGLIDFQCILRTIELRKAKRCDQYGAVFSGIPSVGFSTYGEQYLGHINQTSTILLFR